MLIDVKVIAGEIDIVWYEVVDVNVFQIGKHRVFSWFDSTSLYCIKDGTNILQSGWQRISQGTGGG